MQNLAKNTFAALVATMLSHSAFAQQVNQQAQPVGVAAKGTTVGRQEGIVYPGQPTQSNQQGYNQAQAPMQAQNAPGSPGTPIANNKGLPQLPPLPGEISAAHQAVDDIMPADVAQELTELRKRVDQVVRAGSTPVKDAPKPKSGHVELTQKPDEEPPTVRVTPGTPTNLIFTDVTGAPWPIEYAVPGSSGQFDFLLPSPGTPTMQIRAKSPYSYGGVSVKLEGNPIPVSITISAAQKIVDVRLDVVLLKRGPNAKAPMIESSQSNGLAPDLTLTSFLYGVPPSGAKELKTSSRSVQAWNYRDLMYVRSTVPLVSPNPIGASQTVDGTFAYVFTPVPVVNITSDGTISSISVSE